MAVIGAGRAGTTFGVLLQRAGHPVVTVSGGPETKARAARFLPGARFLPTEDPTRGAAEAAIVILGVPDDVIEATCDALSEAGAFHPGQRVVHLSGSVGLDALAGAAAAGAEPLSLHPLLVFPSVEKGVERLPGTAIAVTAASEAGFRAGEELARDVGGRPFRLSDEVKPLYHAAAVFCSNYVVASVALGEELFRLAGLEDPRAAFAPLARAALDSALSSGPEPALTGPAARGDVGTVARNLRALTARAPDAVESYVALARVAAVVAHRSGRLGEEDRRRLEQELDRWS